MYAKLSIQPCRSVRRRPMTTASKDTNEITPGIKRKQKKFLEDDQDDEEMVCCRE